ncbi:hypothetical protein HDU91_005752 [Kappamyces sp. JEL0680]|nr:hypothetical protein HDU91_005752 [Kappamyces sp. JEL0680]
MGAMCRDQHISGKASDPAAVSRSAAAVSTPPESAPKKTGETKKTKRGLVLVKAVKQPSPDQAKPFVLSASAAPFVPSGADKPLRAPVPRPTRSLETKLAEATTFEQRAKILKDIQIKPVLIRYPTAVLVSNAQSHDRLENIRLVPSDPDFAFDLEALHLTIHLNKFPSTRNATITVHNPDIPLHLRSAIERAFARKCNTSDESLLHLLNWLDRELETLLIEKHEQPNTMDIKLVPHQGPGLVAADQDLERRLYYGGPRFDRVSDDEESDKDSTDHSTVDGPHNSTEQSQDASAEAALTDTTKLQEKGTSIQLLDLNLKGIAVISTDSLHVTVQCSRCKTHATLENVKANPTGALDWTSLECPKCSNVVAANFRPDTIHAQNPRMGFLDLVDCTIVEIAQGRYLATCAECSTIQSTSACFRSYSGNVSGMNCRNCHALLVFSASGTTCKSYVTRVELSASTLAKIKAQKVLRKREKREGISVGEPLPKNGTCAHYRRSYRWFRFPCCGKLFPCDDCHQEANSDGHEIVWATRMICGFCSREQPYSQRPCSCGKDLTGNQSSGFWEGGHGTRDQRKMNKNDPKKYKGNQKTVSNREKDRRHGKNAEKLPH